jgi:predicted FMN-binding regulatory protein PaiB
MNERIKELMRQACKESIRPESVLEDVPQDVLEKFAELIVRECIEQLVMEGDAWEQFSRNLPQGQENNASAALFAAYRLKEDAVARLEEHFGVEE